MSTAKFSTWLNPNGTENYKCRAWVNFNGTGTVAIRASGNVSSISDNGTGDYTVNFTTAMPDANYAVMQCGDNASASGGNYLFIANAQLTPTTTAVRLRCMNMSSSGNSGAIADATLLNVSIFR